MFTGVVENIGKIVSAGRTPAGARLGIQIGELAREVKPGGSVAVNGVCLTAVSISDATVEFDVIYETLSRSNLGRLSPGDSVNIERSLKISDRIEGHFVQGHIDTTCRIAEWQNQGSGRLLSMELSDVDCAKYVIPKGSVALDGISLTVASVSGPRFAVALIPTTLEKTTLINKPVGAVVNFEGDILVKTVVNVLRQMSSSDEKLMDTLARSGFLG